jgi:PAS domain S-box-containing protein
MRAKILHRWALVKPDLPWRRASAWLLQSFLGSVSVMILTVACFYWQVDPTTVALLYLIVIVLVSLKGDLLPAALVSIVAYLCLDAFFTAPLFHLAMREPLDLVAPIAFLSTAFVITRLIGNIQRSFREIQALKDQIQLVIDTIPGLVWSTLPDGSAEFLNQRWLEYTGLPPEEGLDWGGKLALHPEDRERFITEWQRALLTGQPLESEARLQRADGEYRSLLIRAVPVYDEQGQVQKWYGACTDIEDRRRAEEVSRKAQAELAQITRVVTMGELAASIAHEVNQPLAAIVNNASACLRWLGGAAPNLAEANQAAQRIIRDGTRAGEVISRTRAFLRKTVLSRTRLDINQIIHEVLLLTQSEARAKKVTIRLDLATLPTVMGESVQLQQVVLNLVVNGIEAMTSSPTTPRELWITSRLLPEEKILVGIRDTGVGIDPGELERVFDAFYTTKPQGLGMGLAISRSIVEDHGGRLWAEPNEGPGTTFQFTLRS